MDPERQRFNLDKIRRMRQVVKEVTRWREETNRKKEQRGEKVKEGICGCKRSLPKTVTAPRK